MNRVHTVLGPILPEELGRTDCHNHLFIRGGMPVLRYPDFKLVDYRKIAEEALSFLTAGGKAIVEMSPIDWGRSTSQLVQLSEELGLHVVAATGFHKTWYYSDIHWIYDYSEDDIVNLICAELTEGMDVYNYSGPLIKRCKATAGVIKVATQVGQFSGVEKKLMRSAARAHLMTGAPIITHTDEGALALEQVEYLTALGVSPNRIALSHIDRRSDISFHSQLARLGCYLEYDALTRVSKGFDNSTLELILQMARLGYGDKILLGGDISRQSYWRSYGGEPGLAFIMGEFRKRLHAARLGEFEIDALYINNPRSFLTWAVGN